MVSVTRSLVVLSLLACAFAAPETREEHHRSLIEAKAAPKESFDSWLARFDKAYETVEEYEHRFVVWLDNLDFAHSYNQEHKSHWLGLTQFADLTHDEYKTHALGYRADLRQADRLGSKPFSYANVEAPKAIDWRKKGAVTAVKNQAQCGSCWAFSTTGSVEGINQIVTKELVALSEQELLDCDTERDHGCSGGLMDFAYQFIIDNGGIDTEDDWKYLAEEEACDPRKEGRHVVTIDGFEDVPPNDESSLQKAVAMQPVSVAIEADERPFQLYQGGIFDAPCGTALDHGVLVVGYGTEGGADYWIVKNSWGAEWGDHGYIRLVRNTANSEGQCGIAMQASYPIKKGPNPPPGPEPPGPSPPGPVPPPGPPPPGPVECDDTTECPNGSTCCCMREFFGYCFTWACCPLVEATCCEDHEHCCPQDLPVCDVTAGRCLAQAGTIEGSMEWSTKTPATKIHPTGNRFLPHLPKFGRSDKQQQPLVVT